MNSASFKASLEHAMDKRKALVSASKGRIAIFAHGVGEWTITLGKHASVTERAELESDLVCVWSGEAFEQLTAGEAAKPVSVIGDSALLKKLGRLLTPSKKARAKKPEPVFSL